MAKEDVEKKVNVEEEDEEEILIEEAKKLQKKSGEILKEAQRLFFL